MSFHLPLCIAAATATRAGARRPVVIDGETVGSVALDQLELLRTWPRWVEVGAEAVTLQVAPPERDAALDEIHRRLFAEGRLGGWRDETFAIVGPRSGRVLALIERTAARFWGTLTHGAHANGYLADAQGHPTHLWIAQRAFDKPTDPGLLDNLIGGGVPHGEPPALTLVREGLEEAGLDAATLQAARPAGRLTVCRDVAEGLQHECLHVFDLPLPAGLEPRNQDGEVAGFQLLDLDAVQALAWGEAMTMDSALVTVDFLRRHGHIDVPGLDAALAALRSPAAPP